MTAEPNPYRPPAADVLGPPVWDGVRWRRLLVYAFAIAVAPQVLGFVSGFFAQPWAGDTVEDVLANVRLGRMVALLFAQYFLYVHYLRGVVRHRAAHAVAVYVVASVL